MRFIDEKGRIFGKVNIIDAAILVLLITILVTWAGLIKKTTSVKDFFEHEIVIAKCEWTYSVEIYKLMKKGDKSINSNLGFYGSIEKIEEIPDGVEEFKNKMRERVAARIWFRIKVYVDNDLMLYESGAIKPGNTLFFITEKYTIPAKIISITRPSEE